MKYLSIGKGLNLPLDAATQKCAFIGRSSSGKSYAASKFAEELLEAGVQTVILDPVGIWHGLRTLADGKGKGFPIPIFGGEYGDIPLLPSSGALIANVIIEKGISAVLDVSHMRKGERKEFVTAFAEQFFHLKKKNRSAVHLIIEESQVFIPQRTMHGEERMLGAMEDICKLGRNYGIGITLISQRPQSIHKDCLNQTEALFAFQINGAHERKAIEDWIVDKGLSKSTVGEDLSGLSVGTCFLWSPQWLRILKKIKILPKKTFDASETPKVGQGIVKARHLAPVDLEKIKEDMESVINTKKENDPAELKKQIFLLQKELKGKQKVVEVQVPVKDNSEVIALRTKISEYENRIKKDGVTIRGLYGKLTRFQNNLSDINSISESLSEFINQPSIDSVIKVVSKSRMIPEPEKLYHGKAGTGKTPVDRTFKSPTRLVEDAFIYPLHNARMPVGEKAVLIALAQFRDGLYRTQITVMTQYAKSSRDTYIHRLKDKGLVTTTDKIKITEEGIRVLGTDYKPLPVGDDLRQHWLNTLPRGEKVLLELICEAYPNPLMRDDLTLRSGYAKSSRDTYLHRMLNKEIIETVNRGGIIASETLFS